MLSLYADSINISLPQINLSSIAKDQDTSELSHLFKLIIAVAVECPRNQYFISKMQEISLESQQSIMMALESVF